MKGSGSDVDLTRGEREGGVAGRIMVRSLVGGEVVCEEEGEEEEEGGEGAGGVGAGEEGEDEEGEGA